MKRTITIAAVALTALALAAPAHAETVVPPSWTCTTASQDAASTTLKCRSAFTVKAGRRSDQYLWAVKVAKARVTAQALALGAPAVFIPVMGCRQVKGRTWKCQGQFDVVIPAPAP
jgi:hypothetical protein